MTTINIPDELYERLCQQAQQKSLSIEGWLEESLTSSDNDRYRKIIESTLEAIYLLESVFDDAGEIIDFRIIEANPRGIAEMGLSREELIGGLICELFPINRTNGYFEQYKHVAETGEPLDQEYFIPEGHTASGWYHHQVVRVDGGVVIVNQNISQRKANEQKLVQQGNTLAMSLQAAKAGVWVWDVITNRVIWDAKMEQIYGFTPGTFGGTYKAWAAGVHPDDFEMVADALRAALNDKQQPFNIEFRIVRPDHTVRMVHGQAVVIRDEKTGEPIRMIGVNIDVTERHEAQKALHASEARYRTIAENFPDGMLALYDHDLRYTVVNGQGLAVIGLTPADLEGRRLRDIFSPDVYKRDEPQLLAGLEGKKTSLIVPFGDDLFNVTTLPVTDSHGEIMGGMMMSQNITALKTAENALRETVDQLELAIQTAQLGVWQLDVKTGKLTWNQQLHAIYGISPEEFEQNMDGWRDSVHPEDKDFAERYFAEIMTLGQVTDVHYRIIHPEEGVRFIVASGRAIYNDAGEVVKIIGINQDVTDYERSRRDLEASEARYRALFDGFINPIVVYDEDARILMLNPTAAQNLQVTQEEAIGTFIGDYLPENQAMTVERIHQAQSAQSSMIVEDFIELPDRKVSWFWSVIQPVSYQGVKGAQIISYDVTERKEAEDREQERARLEQQLEREQFIAKQNSRLISIISHEFRTPMTIIQSSSEILANYYDRLTPQMMKEKTDRIIEQINHINQMLDEIGRVSRANRGFLDYKPRKTDIALLCQNVINELHDAARENHTLKLTIDKSDTTTLLDDKLLYHALANLIMNAIKYSPQGGVVQLHVEQKNGFWQFHVSDEGMGIPQEDQDALWVPFSRASNVGTIRGTGIGLSIVKEVASYHKGWVKLESKLGLGSTFTIAIPTVLGNLDDNLTGD